MQFSNTYELFPSRHFFVLIPLYTLINDHVASVSPELSLETLHSLLFVDPI